MSQTTRRARTATGIAAALAALAAAAPVAQADDAAAVPAAAAPATCPGHVFTQPLAPFGDPGDYLLAPGADFESGLAGFTVTGAAAVQDGNEPAAVMNSADSHSLALPAGSSVTTPPLCVTEAYPTMRLFARRDAGHGKLLVEAIYTDGQGRSTAKNAGKIHADDAAGGWILSDDLQTFAGKDHTSLSIRLTADRKSDWSVDDVLVDPHTRG